MLNIPKVSEGHTYESLNEVIRAVNKAVEDQKSVKDAADKAITAADKAEKSVAALTIRVKDLETKLAAAVSKISLLEKSTKTTKITK